MTYLLEALNTEWAIRALVASSMVGISCGTVGAFIVLRNMSLIGDALSHSILPGIVFAFVLFGKNDIAFFFGAVLAGMFTAIAITWIQHNARTKGDAAIGIVFIAMFSIGVIGISQISSRPGVHLDLKDFLFGQVMGISNTDVLLTFAVMLTMIASIALMYRYLFITTFQETIAQTMGINVKMTHYFLMLLLSFAVVSALGTVGVIPVIAMLITPAATALLLSNKLKNVLFLSAVLGLLSAILGLIFAIIFDAPPGPAMCLVATTFYLLAVFLAPKKGLVIRAVNRKIQAKKIIQEDIVKKLFKNKTPLKNIDLQQYLNLNPKQIRDNLSTLTKNGLVQITNGSNALSIKGKQSAEKLIRAHRLWETYLVNETGLSEEQIHLDAEKLEHLLSDELIDEMDQKLGFPDKDPHGSPIPQKQERTIKSLLSLKPKDRGIIAKEQINNWVESELWELGLLPESSFRVVSINADTIKIQTSTNEFEIVEKLARLINIRK